MAAEATTANQDDLLERVLSAERRIAQRTLARRSASSLLDLATDAAARLDDLIRRHPAPAGERPVCRAGCSWCCHVLVAVAAPEALAIAHHIQNELPAEQAAMLAAATVELDERVRGLDADERAVRQLPCAFLVEGKCAIYPVRPLLCRGWNSLDVVACRENYRQPDIMPVTVYALQRRLGVQVADGVDTALTEAGLGGGTDLELTAAVRIALEAPDAAERVLAGEPIFAPAKVAD
jgi:putative zinc- or iron-chelating protein